MNSNQAMHTCSGHLTHRQLTALMSGMALTTSALATEAGVTVQTASAHLKNLGAGWWHRC